MQNQRSFGLLKDVHAVSRGKSSPQKLLAGLLKRQADSAMEAVTECPEASIHAHVITLDNVTALVRHGLNHDLVDERERARSERQLIYAQTLADYLEALIITRKSFRAPVWTSGRDAQLAEINRKLEVLAGCFAQSPALNAALDGEGL